MERIPPATQNGMSRRRATCGDIVKNELIHAVIAVVTRFLEDVPHDLMIAKADTLYDETVAHV
jgi:hypothetical protein